MIRFARALAWLRWRTLANALRRVGRRDVLGGLSQAAEALLPALVLLFLIPPALGVGIAAFWASSTTLSPGRIPARSAMGPGS